MRVYSWAPHATLHYMLGFAPTARPTMLHRLRSIRREDWEASLIVTGLLLVMVTL